MHNDLEKVFKLDVQQNIKQTENINRHDKAFSSINIYRTLKLVDKKARKRLYKHIEKRFQKMGVRLPS